MDKSAVNLFNDANVSNNIFDQLVQFDSAFNLKPMLATDFHLVTNTIWEFTLRRGVRFQDGEPFDGEAIRTTVDWAKRPESKISYLVNDIASIEMVTPYVLRIHTTIPDAILPNKFAWIDIVPPKVASLPDFGEHPVGTGPYTLAQWSRGQSITLAANANYWGGSPRVPTVMFRFVTEPSTSLAMLLRGEADLIPNGAPDDGAVLQRNPAVKAISQTGLKKMAVVMSNMYKPFNDLRVRQAMNYAIDRDSIIKNIFLGYATKSLGMTQTTVPGHVSRFDSYYDYNPAKAKALLSAAGYPDGFSVTYYTTSGVFPKDVEAAQAITAQLAKIGVKTQLAPMEWGKFASQLMGMKMEALAQTRWGNSTGDASEQYFYNFCSCGIRHYITDPRVDELFQRAQITMDPTARLALFRQLEQYTVESVAPWIWLYDLRDIYGVSNRLQWRPHTRQETIDLRGTTLSAK